MTAYDQLCAYDRETQALSAVAGRLGWDQETQMPRGAATQRGEEMAAMEAVLHARQSAPQLADLLHAVDPASLDDVGQARLREIQRGYDRAAKVPAELATALARATSLGHGIWAEARAKEDFSAFAPALTEILRLSRELAAALAGGAAPYDALLQDYEPGTTGAEITTMFDALRPRLVALADKIKGAPAPAALTGTFGESAQLALSREVAECFGYAFDRGRLDQAVHPFCSGHGSDVRITTRTNGANPFDCLYSTVHEVGHACYEQGVDAGFALTALGKGVSMGVHESQSRIFENQLGRSRAFAGFLFQRLRHHFGALSVSDADGLYAAANRVTPGFIRTEADEVHYNLHIMLRFDLEQALISGALEVPDLPEAWNARFAADFGTEVDRPSHGVLQDVHWSAGLFGYFPTYTLGNVYAGCLYAALRDAVPDLDAALARGETAPATTWLRENLQHHGALRSPRDTIQHATGAAPTVEPLLQYLEAKFGALYGL